MSERIKGATSVSLLFRLTDITTGAPRTGLDVTTLKLQYARPGVAPSAATSLTLLGAHTTAYTAFGAIEVDSTNSPGVYRVDVPNAALASGADEVSLTVNGAAISAASRLIDLTAFDSRNAVNGALTALPAAAASAAGGLPTVGTGTGQISLAAGLVSLAVGSIDMPTLTPAVRQQIGHGYIITTGVTTPVSAATDWAIGTTYLGTDYYFSVSVSLYAWTDGSFWYISSTAPGVSLPSGYWKTASGATATGPYTAQGGSPPTGFPAVAYRGNSVLAAFQPNGPANFATLAIDASGRTTLAPSGLDAVKGWGTWSARQTIQAVAQFILGKRSGVPLAGSAGTITYQDNASFAYGTIVVDTTGDVVTSNITPPA